MIDKDTIAAYAQHTADYVEKFGKPGNVDRHLAAFIAAVPAGGRVLDLGCGPGAALRELKEAGFDAQGLDASPEFVAVAIKTSGANVIEASFDHLEKMGEYHGIYANFSLLHAPKSEMPAHLERISNALVEDGFFHIGLKTGEGEARDRLGRFYAYYGRDELVGLLADAGLEIMQESTGADVGLEGTKSPWIILLTRKIT